MVQLSTVPTAYSALESAVLKILKDAHRGKGMAPTYVSAYQVLDRLDVATRNLLTSQYGDPGKGSGIYFSGASRVAQICTSLSERNLVEVVYMDTSNVRYFVGGVIVAPGYEVCGLYRAL